MNATQSFIMGLCLGLLVGVFAMLVQEAKHCKRKCDQYCTMEVNDYETRSASNSFSDSSDVVCIALGGLPKQKSIHTTNEILRF